MRLYHIFPQWCFFRLQLRHLLRASMCLPHPFGLLYYVIVTLNHTNGCSEFIFPSPLLHVNSLLFYIFLWYSQLFFTAYTWSVTFWTHFGTCKIWLHRIFLILSSYSVKACSSCKVVYQLHLLTGWLMIPPSIEFWFMF